MVGAVQTDVAATVEAVSGAKTVEDSKMSVAVSQQVVTDATPPVFGLLMVSSSFAKETFTKEEGGTFGSVMCIARSSSSGLHIGGGGAGVDDIQAVDVCSAQAQHHGCQQANRAQAGHQAAAVMQPIRVDRCIGLAGGL